MTTTLQEALEPITLVESARFIALEKVINCGLNTFRDVGSALYEIREKRYFRAEHLTFEEYCDKRWGFSKQHAYRLVFAEKLSRKAEDLGLPAPETERAARAFSSLPEEKQVDAYQEAVEKADGEAPTTAIAVEVVEEVKRRPKSNPRVTPEAGFSADDLLHDKDLSKALAHIKKVCGSEAVDSIRRGTVPMTKKEVVSLANYYSNEKTKGLFEVMAARAWSLKEADVFLSIMVSEKTSVEGLILHAIALGGKLEAKVNGWTIEVKR